MSHIPGHKIPKTQEQNQKGKKKKTLRTQQQQDSKPQKNLQED
jgi:hypothetical protein